MENTKFSQFIQYKALSLKFDDSGKLMYLVLDQESETFPVKNVCAKLHIDLVEELDKTVNMLNISKREFIEYAIIEALDKADKIIKEVNINEFIIPHEHEEAQK